MTRPIWAAFLGFAVGTAALRVPAQQSIGDRPIGTMVGQQLPPIRPLGAIVARVADSLASINGIRPLSDGRVLVNDPASHRLILIDSTLRHAIVVMDSTSNNRRAYGRGYGGILPYTGDSTLFVDPRAEAFVVLDPTGKVIRVMAVPDASAVGQISGPLQWGTAGFDAHGHLVYGTFPKLRQAGDTSNRDSTAVLRANLVTRSIDTLGFIRVDLPRAPVVTTGTDGNPITTPAPVRLILPTDEWGILADGSIAFVRGSDYHIDWVGPDGSQRSTPRMAHTWVRLTDSVKAVLLDSVARFLNAHPFPLTVRQPDGRNLTHTVVVPLDSALPDYPPPFWRKAVKGDADGNLWIREGGPPLIEGFPGQPSLPLSSVYDIVNEQGVVVDRIEIPGGATIVGFGPGVVYLASREGPGVTLVRARDPIAHESWQLLTPRRRAAQRALMLTSEAIEARFARHLFESLAA